VCVCKGITLIRRQIVYFPSLSLAAPSPDPPPIQSFLLAGTALRKHPLRAAGSTRGVGSLRTFHAALSAARTEEQGNSSTLLIIQECDVSHTALLSGKEEEKNPKRSN